MSGRCPCRLERNAPEDLVDYAPPHGRLLLPQRPPNFHCVWPNQPVIHSWLLIEIYPVDPFDLLQASLSWIAVHQATINYVARPFITFMELGAIAWVFGKIHWFYTRTPPLDFHFLCLSGTKALNEAHVRCTKRQVPFPSPIFWKFLPPIQVFVSFVLRNCFSFQREVFFVIVIFFWNRQAIFIFGIAKSPSLQAHGKLRIPSGISCMGIYLILIMTVIILVRAILTWIFYNESKTTKMVS